MAASHPFYVMAKPGGPRCNIDCTYCYYLEKDKLYPQTGKFRMAEEVLEEFVRGYIASQADTETPETWFMWQGGEPTLLGVDYFRRIVELQTRHCPPEKTIRNAFQTNGILLDDEWAAFFRDNEFLVGISVDGPREIHDKYRLDRARRPTFDKVMRGYEMLRKYDVDTNALTVVQRHNSRRPKEVYRFLKKAGFEFIQFIPIVERTAGGAVLAGAPQTDQMPNAARVTPWSVLPEDYGNFLIAVFDEWIRKDVGKIFVQFFDMQLGLWSGMPASLCVFAETCGRALAVEHNGDVYACDHYVYPEYRLGNIMESPVGELAMSSAQQEFGLTKRDGLCGQCLSCEYLFACNGGCPKHRISKTSSGEPGLNYFCSSNRIFFRHAGPYLNRMADLMRYGHPAAMIMDALKQESERRAQQSKRNSTGRNDSCPCGSGRKFKVCCGAS